MYLKRVELSGFKSFAAKTVLDFMPASNDVLRSDANRGITAIVGPNGSGKSNIADAIRWVMGEQSMKSLRGKKSEDIIYAGSKKKSRLSAASVSLVFDNTDKRIPLDFSEVVITRKIFRGAESEYRINGSSVRLMDVIDLLAKAGVGKESYCVVTQGMTDAALNATPQERREIIEDAAGVKQYQIKKERSARKLELTKNNLERVQGLVQEIEPHLKMLKRQAEKAQKGKEVHEQLKSKQRELFGYLWHTYRTEHAAASERKNQIGIDVMNAQREVDQLSDAIAKESATAARGETLLLLEKERSALQEKLHGQEKDLVITEGRLEITKERRAMEAAVRRIPVDLVYVGDRIAALQKKYDALFMRLATAVSQEAIVALRADAEDLRSAFVKLRDEISKDEVDVPAQHDAAALAAYDRTIADYGEKITAVRAAVSDTRSDLDGITQQILQERKKDHDARGHFFELEKRLRGRQDALSLLKDRFNEAKVEIAKIDVRMEDLTSEVREELGIETQHLSFDSTSVDRGTLEKEIARLHAQHEQIGGIDPLVVEEYTETQERFDFLLKESEDLDRAIISLKEVIKEMEQKIRDEFSKAFERINAEFTKYFRIIFSGGNAHLTKVTVEKCGAREEERVGDGIDGEEKESMEPQEKRETEIGIDIIAAPPGKRITHLPMLSGGERSLTSLALLFAVISYNPPPFAILDEVEAALDEANSRRFGRILQELSTQTQFVIITHNRETMRQASLLYGVTMTEEGGSRVLSVRLDQAKDVAVE